MHANWLVFSNFWYVAFFFLIVCLVFFYLIFFNICQGLGLLKSKLCSCIFFYPTLFMKWFKKKCKLCAQIVFFFYILCCFSICSRFPKHWMSITILSFFCVITLFCFYSNNNAFCLASHLRFFFLCRLNLAILPLCISLPAFFSISFKNQHSILAKEYFS